MEIELLDEKLDIKELKNKNKWVKPLNEFIESDKKSMIIRCSNPQERRNGVCSLSTMARKKHLNLIVGSHGPVEIYVIKG